MPRRYRSLLFLSYWIAFSHCISSDKGVEAVVDSYWSWSQEGIEDGSWYLAAVPEQKEKVNYFLEELASIDPTELTVQDRISYDLLKLTLDDRFAEIEFDNHLMPLNAEGGFLTGMLFRFRNMQLEDEEDRKYYLSLLQKLPAYLQSQQTRMESGIEKERTLPIEVLDNSRAILDELLSQNPEETVFLRPADGLDEAQQKEARIIVVEKVFPAITSFNSFLRGSYQDQLRSGPGVGNLPQGKAFYADKVKYYTTLDMTPEEVFERGQSEVARIRAEMEAIIDSLDFAGSFEEFFEFLRTDPRFYPQTPEELLKEAAWLSKKAEELLPRYFTVLPRLPFTVNPVPEAIAPTYTTGRYSGGSFEDKKPGEYWVNTYKLESRTLYTLPALTLHEAVPGHHLQISLAQELGNLSPFRNKTYISAFGEGWALYTEYLGKEAGYYRDYYEEFGRLTYEMWRACRLVVDPGIHYFGWSRERAFDFMSANTALSLHEVNTEIDRYIGWPGQAVSYKIGELIIRDLRKKSEMELGTSFDIRAFHDKVLENGSIPLSSLIDIVNEWIEDQKELENQKNKEK